MLQIGFGTFCSNHDGSLNTNHTFRLKNLNFKNLYKTFILNLNNLFKLLELCKSEQIEVFRIGSNFIPFASHPKFCENWFFKLEPLLYEASKIVKSNYNIRITMHPAQYVILNSTNPKVVENSIRELEYHFWLLDNLGINKEGIVIIHIGGIYDNKSKSIERFMNVVEKHNWLKKRLAIENDERHYCAKEVLNISKDLKIPFVFDYFHHILNPSDFSINDIFDTWISKGIPKIHLSSKGNGKRGTHGEYVDIKDFITLKKLIEKGNIKKIHIMIEAKKKEKAIFKLREELNHLNLI